MLLVLVLFILAQFLNYEQIFIQEEIDRRKERVETQIHAETVDREGIAIEVVSDDDLSQRIRVTGELVFEECRDDLRPTGRELLMTLGTTLGRNQSFFESVQVEGHADRQGPTGIVCQQAGIEDNWQLSAQRATEVVRLFSSSELFEAAQLSSVGRGEYHPLSDPSDTTATALSRDRRIEIVLRYSQQGILGGSPDD
ncbi:OmpA/MotB family protein [Candidatus Palauibacter sp.]|uniref:OmpA/MotB family protein n=1 Tax=Candidatus Palauibacter sp. TaxID=3101350 RepID=UPI003B02244B